MFLINVLLIKVLNVILYTIKFKPSNIKMSRFELFILHPLFHEIKERGNITRRKGLTVYREVFGFHYLNAAGKCESLR